MTIGMAKNIYLESNLFWLSSLILLCSWSRFSANDPYVIRSVTATDFVESGSGISIWGSTESKSESSY